MGGKGPPELMVEGKNINDMQWPALQRHVVEMTNALLLERGERTRTRKECDKLRTCWENSEKDLEETKAKLLTKYLEDDVLWKKHEQPYAEKEQEITYQKYILNFDMQFQDKERRKRLDEIKDKWDKLVLPKMMAANTKEAQRFDKKQKELNKEYQDVKLEYQAILDQTIRDLDDKLYDWKEDLSKRATVRRRYNDLQFLLRQLSYSEQKNLLIHDLNAGYQVDFEKIRGLMKERIEGDTVRIVSLNEELIKCNQASETARIEIERYTLLNERNLKEYHKVNKSLKLYEFKLITYKQNVDKALRCERLVKKLKKEKEDYDKRKCDLENEVIKRMKDKQKYVDIMLNIQKEMKELQTSLFGEDLDQLMLEYEKDLKEFDDLFLSYEKIFPKKALRGKEEFLKEQAILKDLPFLITREIKGHNDFLQSAMHRMCEIGVHEVPAFVRVTSDSYPTGIGPAGLTYT